MNIVFICGSMEPGQDGVGDYTRRLALELIRQNNKVAIIAVNDYKIGDIEYEQQSESNTYLEVMRIPTYLKEKVRFQRAKEWIDNLNPDFISIQFVPFAFHPKGLSFSISSHLRAITRGKPVNIMFHELWVGIDESSNLKFRTWGAVQKYLIKNLVNSIKPVVIHTQTKIYQHMLSNLGFNARYLPLFSNIPVARKSKNEISFDAPKTKGQISFVIFGGIHPNALVADFAEELALYAKTNEKNVCLKIVGRTGVETNKWVTSFQAVGLTVEVFGEQSAEQVSFILASSSYGISTTSIALIEKSGSVAAMRTHKLPVISVAKPWRHRNIASFTSPMGVCEYKKGNLQIILDINHPVSLPDLADISKQFVESLALITE